MIWRVALSWKSDSSCSLCVIEWLTTAFGWLKRYLISYVKIKVFEWLYIKSKINYSLGYPKIFPAPEVLIRLWDASMFRCFLKTFTDMFNLLITKSSYNLHIGIWSMLLRIFSDFTVTYFDFDGKSADTA